MNSQQIVVMEITDPVMPDPRPQESANVPAGGEVAAATESIEPARELPLSGPRSGALKYVHGGNGAAGTRAT